ncbi:MAG: PKD domain-containing protein, partial [Thermoplasmatales archaeon]
LDNGNTLITEGGNNRVIEIDSSGLVLWEKTGLNSPVDAERLDNGNTLIVEADNNRVIEIDDIGTILWEEADLNYPSDAERLPPPNDPPEMPTQPHGPTDGIIGESYSYSTDATDPDDNMVKYYFDWGDETGIWSELVNSGQSVSVEHIWNSSGLYQVKAKAQDEYGLVSEWSPFLLVKIAENKPPEKPNIPTGPSSGEIGKTYIYSTSTIDPEGHKICYLFNWGDGTDSNWSELFNSGETVSISHNWVDIGDYQVIVKAKDIYGNESEWSDPLGVSMPKNKNKILIIVLSYDFLKNLNFFNF